VFNKANTIKNTQFSKYINIKHYILDAASLHVVITSQSSTAKDMTWLAKVQVGEMEEDQAVNLFVQYS
jgi:hypothetical protein